MDKFEYIVFILASFPEKENIEVVSSRKFNVSTQLMTESQETGMTLTGGDTIAARCTIFSMDQIDIQQILNSHFSILGAPWSATGTV